MSARQREGRLRSPRQSIPAWSGTLACADDITGHLTCLMTGWRLALTGAPDGRGVVRLTAEFTSPPMADEAPPWTDEHELAKPHEAEAAGYIHEWTGVIRSADRQVWVGELGDRYGNRLAIKGAAQGGGVMLLRAKVQIDGQRS